MKAYQIGTIAVILFTVVTGFQNCGRSMTSAATANAAEAKSTRTIAQLQELSARDLHCGRDGDCLAIPVGHKACGGPTDYVLASVNNPDLEQMHALAAQSAVEDEAAQNNRVASTCDYRLPPVAACLNQICQSAPRNVE